MKQNPSSHGAYSPGGEPSNKQTFLFRWDVKQRYFEFMANLTWLVFETACCEEDRSGNRKNKLENYWRNPFQIQRSFVSYKSGREREVWGTCESGACKPPSGSRGTQGGVRMQPYIERRRGAGLAGLLRPFGLWPQHPGLFQELQGW